MRHVIACAALAAALACGACSNSTPAQTAAGTAATTLAASAAASLDPKVAVAGQLFCELGPSFAAIAGVTVTGQQASYVAAACAAWNPAATPVPAPSVSSVPVVTVSVPAT
jgi:hypothetical protein